MSDLISCIDTTDITGRGFIDQESGLDPEPYTLGRDPEVVVPLNRGTPIDKKPYQRDH